ncbi:MAG: hypothetical protein ACR2IK_21040 [Chloroflexota bacterium]
MLQLEPDGPHATQWCLACAHEDVFVGGMLFDLTRRGLERFHHASNRRQVGSAERRPSEQREHLVARLLNPLESGQCRAVIRVLLGTARATDVGVRNWPSSA